MIRVHHYPNLTARGRASHAQDFAPGMRVGDVVPGRWTGSLLRNGAPCDREELLRDGDHVHMVAVPHDPVSILVSLILSYVAGEIIRRLIPAPDSAKERGDEKSPTHGFSRMKNIRVEGQPIPRGYGRHRVPGTIINEFIEVNNSTGDSTYYALVVIGHGLVSKIAGATVDTPTLAPLKSEDDTITSEAFINDNPISNFSGVEMWVRLGSNDQTVIPGFERAKTISDINVFLTQDDIGVTTDAIADYNSADGDPVWEEFGFAFDTLQENVDGVEVVINFPNGLYLVDDLGNIQTSRWVLAIRFAKLDGSNNPVLGPGTGGNQDDGWVRLPFQVFNLDRQSPFQLSFPVWLYDPVDHIDPAAGDALHTGVWASGSEGWRTDLVVDAAHRPSDWPSLTGTCDEFTFETWIAFDTVSAQGPFSFSGADHYVCLFEWSGDGLQNGVWCGFRVTESGEWFPHFQVGKWDRFEEWHSAPIVGTTDVNEKIWFHVVFTHRRLGSSNNITTCYINGVSYGDFNSNIDIICPNQAESGGDQSFRFGFSNRIRTSDNSFRGWWDETSIRDQYAYYGYVQDRYNGGAGQIASGANPNRVALYHFNGSTFADATDFDNNAIQIGGDTSFAVGGGLVSVFTAAGRTRGKYRVQVLRVNGEPAEPGGARRQDTAEWQLAVSWIDEAFNYPGAAYYGVIVPASEQLNSSAPNLTAICDLAVVPIWDQVSTIAPSFKKEFSRNVAWAVLDAVTDPIYGGGSAFGIENVDMVSLQAFADANDKRVYDGRGRRDFYRQEFENQANLVTSPETFGSGFWSGGTAVVTDNTATAPDGQITADELDDADGAVARFRGAVMTAVQEPTSYSFQLSVKKDLAATSASASIEIVVGGNTVACSFNVDDGTAIANCKVIEHPLDSDWWLVKMSPVAHHGGGAPGETITLTIYPARYDYGTTAVNVALTQSIEVWGAFLHRGKIHLVYPDDSGTARTFLYVGDVDSSSVSQIIPEHWVVGGEVRLRNCTHTAWDTPVAQIVALKIQELEELNEVDGYLRAWKLTCAWYSDDVGDRPGSSFPAIVRGARDWEDVNDDWVESASGIGMLAVFDDGGVTGGPTSTTPVRSLVLEITTDASGDLQQGIEVAFAGETVKARMLVFRPTALTNIGIRVVDGSTTSQSSTVADEWETLEVVHVTDTTAPDLEVFWTGAGGIDAYVDAVSAWVSLDSNGNAPGGEIEGAEALHTYDAQHDTFKDFWKTIVDMCLTARCVPVPEGSTLRFKQDILRTPVGLVTFASTVVSEDGGSSFSVRYTDRSVRPNSYTVDFHDERQNWERKVALKESDDLEGTAEAGLVRGDQFFILGLTRRSAVVRMEKYLIAQNEKLSQEGSFQTGPGAVQFEPGDVLEIAHDLMPWGQSGRCQRGSGRGVNLIAADWNDFPSWTVSSGLVSWALNVRATPDDNEPVADLVTTVADQQIGISKIQTGVLDGTNYAFSIKVRNKSGVRLAISLTQEGSGTQSVIAEFTWATHVLSEFTATGNTLTATHIGDGWWRLGVEFQANGSGDVTMQVVPERSPSDYVGTEVYIAGAQWEVAATGVPTAFDEPGVGIFLDRAVTLDALASGLSYTARVTSGATGESGTGTITSSPGSFSVGDLIDLDTAALGFEPSRGDEYIIYNDAERFQIQIIEMGLNESGVVDVEWIEYDTTVYDGDDLGEDELEESFSSNNGGPGAGDTRENRLPGDPVSISVAELVVNTPAGVSEVWLDVSWQQEPETATSVMETNVFIAYIEDALSVVGKLRYAATVPAGTTSARVRLPCSVVGCNIRVAIQPVSWNGTKKRPELCGGTSTILQALAPKPLPVTNFVAQMEGTEVTFKWDPPAVNDGLIYEIRHGTILGENAQGDLMGGWVLAQQVIETRETFFGPTEWWATCQAASAINAVYMIRARNAHGVFSEVTTLSYGARVLNGVTLDSTNHWNAFISQAWHDYADGWKTDSTPPTYDPSLVNLSRHADGYLTMDSGLTANYRTATIVTGAEPVFFEREEPMRIEAVVFALCRNPTAVGPGDIIANGVDKLRFFTPIRDQVGWKLKGNVTGEGRLQDDLPTLRLQMKLIRDGSAGPVVSTQTDSGGASGWLDYKPGVYVCHGAQFRILLTRPTTDWDVRVHEFYVQVQRALPERHYRSPSERVFAQELFLG